MARKTVWIINQYASTPQTGMGGRHFYLARELAKQGHNVYVIGASFTHLLRHPPKVTKPFDVQSVEGFKFVWVKMAQYHGAHSKKRILNWFAFAFRLQRLKKFIPDSPDVVMYSSPSLIGFLGAKRLAKTLRARLAFEVRDIWPLTLIELGGYSRGHPFIRFLQWLEDKAYSDADFVISNLRKSVDHMTIRGLCPSKFTWIPNGISIDEVSRAKPLNEAVLEKMPRDKFVVGYVGTLGLANAMDVFVDAASLLRHVNEISFVVVGDGREKKNLQERAKTLGLNNIHFIDPVAKSEVQSVLALFDVCYLGWNNDSLYRFGIAPNKIPEYLYSARPVLHSFSGECDSVGEAKAGLTVKAEDPEAAAAAVKQFFEMHASERKSMGESGHLYALEHHDYGKLAQKLSGVLFGGK